MRRTSRCSGPPIVDDPSGGHTFLGESDDSRSSDPNHKDHVFTWTVSRIVDAFGNVTKFNYRARDAQSNQLLVASVQYNGHWQDGAEDLAPNLELRHDQTAH